MRASGTFSRRSALRGLGVGSVLFSGLLRTIRAEAAPPGASLRTAMFFHANGSHYAWTPMGTGENFTLTPHIAPLEPIRKDIIILRNLTMARGGGNAHKAATMSILGCGVPTSFDQQLAGALKGTAPLTSLEMAIGFTQGGGGKVPSLSQVGGTFIPAERNPVAAYQRIAARVTPAPMAGDPAAMENALAARRSVLDYLKDDAARFRGRLGGEEKPKMDFYLQSVNELEKSLGGFVGDFRASPACAKAEAPPMAAGYEMKMIDLPKGGRLLLDVMALALGCGVTRVATMMWGGGENQEDIEYAGIKDWHITTHGNPNGPAGEKVTKMQSVIAGEYAYFVQKLRAMSDGNGTLLDKTVCVWGTQNGNTNQSNFSKEDHDRHNAPFILAGNAGGAFKTGRVVDCNNVNHPDLYLSIAKLFGMNVNVIGDPLWCKGPLAGLAA